MVKKANPSTGAEKRRREVRYGWSTDTHRLKKENAALKARLRRSAEREQRRQAVHDPAAPPAFVSYKEFRRLTGISASTLLRRRRAGLLKVVRYEGRALIPYSEVERLLARAKATAGEAAP